MAEAIINIVAGQIVAKLNPQALENVGKLWDIKHELKLLRDTVNQLRDVLDDAEEQYYQNLQIQHWLEKLKDAFYDAEAVLEEFNIEAISPELRGHKEMMEEVRTFFSSSNQLVFKLKASYKVRAVRKKIAAIQAERKFHLDERPVDSLLEEREKRTREETHSFVQKVEIIGRGDDKKAIIDFLLDSDMKDHISILPIFGIGGLGKTTLAQCVYNDEMVSTHFLLKIWVRVSSDLDVKKIVKNIIAYAKNEEPTKVSSERLQSELRAEIYGKRYLLVLDDLWNAELEKWHSLKDLLLGGARGSKILITTRSRGVADTIGTSPPHLLKVLSQSASLHLFMQMVSIKEEQMQDPDMLAIAKEIVQKCCGIPLVVRSIGSLLFFKKTKFEWLHFKDHVLPEVLPEEFQSEDVILFVLRLSYDNLPSHLKQCFAFCSLFPKDYEIKKQTLIDLWVAEGFIQPLNGSQNLEDIAHGYFMDLLWSNFFQDFQKDSVTSKETCKMPAVMRDLACLVAGSEYWGPWDKTDLLLQRTRHISHGSTSKSMGQLLKLRLKASSLRTFLATPTYHEMEQREPTSEANLCQFIQDFKKLRILDLHATIVKKVPRTVCKLKHLTYLDLSHNSALKRLPNSITRLENLQTLNIQGCFALKELPRGIRKLVKLRNLDINYCYSLSYVPRGLGQLSSLHRLTRFILPKGKALTKDYCRLGELNGLNNLRGSLSIENLGHSRDALAESRAANLKEKHSLESLILKWSYLDIDDAVNDITHKAQLDELRPPSNLQKLMIDGYEGESFPDWMINSLVLYLPNLVEVRLLRCGKCKHLPPLGRLSNLKSLEIWRLTELKNIESVHSSTPTVSFPSLVRLEIRFSENLKVLPLAPHLKDLILREVNRELIDQIIGLNKLKTLDISQMEFLERLPEKCLQSLTSLEHLCISECPRLTFLSHGIQYLLNLVHLSFSNCEELDLSKDESNNNLDLRGLKSLRFVDILGVPKLESLPQWLLQVSNLEHLSIKKCLNLKALPEGIKALRSLQKLEIIRCPSLTLFPKGMRSLPFLSHLRIAGCPNLEERCKSEDLAHIPHITHELEFYERYL